MNFSNAMAICDYCGKEFINEIHHDFCTFCRMFHDDYDLYETLDPEIQWWRICEGCENRENYQAVNFAYGRCNYCILMFV